jgi:hypothetical protein
MPPIINNNKMYKLTLSWKICNGIAEKKQCIWKQYTREDVTSIPNNEHRFTKPNDEGVMFETRVIWFHYLDDCLKWFNRYNIKPRSLSPEEIKALPEKIKKLAAETKRLATERDEEKRKLAKFVFK